jgi:hypothetical protein
MRVHEKVTRELVYNDASGYVVVTRKDRSDSEPCTPQLTVAIPPCPFGQLEGHFSIDLLPGLIECLQAAWAAKVKP